jgi:hypothetical protein
VAEGAVFDAQAVTDAVAEGIAKIFLRLIFVDKDDKVFPLGFQAFGHTRHTFGLAHDIGNFIAVADNVFGDAVIIVIIVLKVV